MKNVFFFFMLLTPLCIHAQNDSKYLEGAVPEIDGKVVFTREIPVPGVSAEVLFDQMLMWAEENFHEGKNRVAYSDRSKGDIAITGEEYLVFSSGALSLDRSLMSYRMTIGCEDNLCKLSFSGIRYEYNVSYQKEAERYQAENWITDKYAVRKGKLLRGSGKFRTATIDYINDLFEKTSNYIRLNIQPVQTITAVHPIAPAPPVTPPAPETSIKVETAGAITEGSLQGFRTISPDKIPGNIIKMLMEDWMLITAGEDSEFNMMTASWGGFGSIYGKAVAFCFIHPSRYTYQLIEKNDRYTLTFYTEAYRDALRYAGSTSGRDKDKVKESGLTPVTTPGGTKAFQEAWMIIECRKIVAAPFLPESLLDENIRKEWDGKELHKMYIGEITNVWIK